jgi:lipopolysaccharide transport protein LptA
MRFSLIISFFIVLLSFEAFAQSDSKVNIKSQNLNFLPEKNYAMFSGDVVLQTNNSTLYSESMEVFFEKTPKKVKNTNNSLSPVSGISRVNLPKKVELKSLEKTITSGSGIYETSSNTVTLRDNVVLKEGNSIARGEKLVFNVQTNEAKFIGKDGKVSGTLSK